MKKKKYFITLIVLFIAFASKVNASTCSDERIIELSALANNVNAQYEEYEDTSNTQIDDLFNTPEEKDPMFYVAIYNLDEGLNAVVTREDIKKAVIVTEEDSDDDGVILIDAGTAYSVKSFSIKIRSNDSNCQNEVLRTMTVTTPMYNTWYNREICGENPEFLMCQKFTTIDYSNMTDKEFAEKVKVYQEEKKEAEARQKSLWYKITSFINKYKLIIIGVIIVIVAIIVIYIISRKKSRLI